MILSKTITELSTLRRHSELADHHQAAGLQDHDCATHDHTSLRHGGFSGHLRFVHGRPHPHAQSLHVRGLFPHASWIRPLHQQRPAGENVCWSLPGLVWSIPGDIMSFSIGGQQLGRLVQASCGDRHGAHNVEHGHIHGMQFLPTARCASFCLGTFHQCWFRGGWVGGVQLLDLEIFEDQ